MADGDNISCWRVADRFITVKNAGIFQHNSYYSVCPVYDFSQHNRSSETLIINPSKVIVVEGILVLHDQRLCDLLDIKIFVDADADERILRRALRDIEERGRDLNNIIEQYLTTVKPMHYLFVEPSKQKADFIINSGLNNVAYDVVATKIGQLLGKI